MHRDAVRGGYSIGYYLRTMPFSLTDGPWPSLRHGENDDGAIQTVVYGAIKETRPVAASLVEKKKAERTLKT